MSLYVDDILEDSTTIPYLTDLSLGDLYLGQLPNTLGRPSVGYVGCMSDIVIGQR